MFSEICVVRQKVEKMHSFHITHEIQILKNFGSLRDVW